VTVDVTVISLRERRKALKLTQVEAARRIGIRQGTLSDYERGVKSPSLEMAHRWAQALGADLLVVPRGDAAQPAGSAYKVCDNQACWCWQPPSPERRVAPTHLTAVATNDEGDGEGEDDTAILRCPGCRRPFVGDETTLGCRRYPAYGDRQAEVWCAEHGDYTVVK
jgi:HTH-type transcriptional regulator/antitoxin HipB